MKLLGNRVYLALPNMPESKLELSPEMKQELKQEMAQKFEKLTVYAVSEGSPISIGDEVRVDPAALSRASIFKIGDLELVCVSTFDIMHIW